MKLKVTALRTSQKRERNPNSKHIYRLSGACRVNGKLVRGWVTCKIEPIAKQVYDPSFMGYVSTQDDKGYTWRRSMNFDFPENMKPLERAQAVRAIGKAVQYKSKTRPMGAGV